MGRYVREVGPLIVVVAWLAVDIVKRRSPIRPSAGVDHAQGVTYTRNELFAKVWSTPMLQLAKEIGVSDVGPDVNPITQAITNQRVPVRTP